MFFTGKTTIKKSQIFESLFESSSIGMALVSIEGKWLRVNQKVCDMLGYSAEELLKIDFQTLTHPEDLDNDLSYLTLVLKNELNSYEIEKRYYSKGGKIVWVRLRVSTVRDNRGTPEVYISQIEDITILKEREAQLNYLIDLGSDGFWDWFLQDDYEYMSPRFWELLGYHAHEKKHHPSEWQKLIFKEDLDKAMENYQLHVESKGQHPFELEVRYFHKNGSIIHVICKGKIVEWDKNGDPVRMIGTHTDISTQKQALLKLEKEKNLHYQTARMASIGNLAGDIAHEINNPLTIISGNSKIIQKEMIKGDRNIERINKGLISISEATDRISDVMRELIKVTGSARTKDFEEIELNDLIDNVFFLCRNSLINHGINIMRQNDLDGLLIKTHRASLVQILLNVIHIFKTNLKDEGHPDERWINIAFEQNEELLTICFAAPIKNDYAKFLDMANAQFDSPNENEKSMKLELSMTKNILHEHGGLLKTIRKDGITEISIALPFNFQKNTLQSA